MKPQFENLATSSFLLWMNNYVGNKGVCYTNTNSLFYPSNIVFNGLYTYASPFNQFVYDSSINGAIIPTGVYINNSFIGIGQSGLVDIDCNRGRVYFSNRVNGVISGSYAIKDFNISLVNVTEEKLLFDTKFSARTEVNEIYTGAAQDGISFPVLFIKNAGTTQQGYAFGGLLESRTTMGVFIFADSQYLLDGIVSMLKDATNLYVPLLSQNEMPFNPWGGTSGISYNYTGVTALKNSNGSGMYINRVDAQKFDYILHSRIQNLNPECYFALVDIELLYVAYSHLR